MSDFLSKNHNRQNLFCLQKLARVFHSLARGGETHLKNIATYQNKNKSSVAFTTLIYQYLIIYFFNSTRYAVGTFSTLTLSDISTPAIAYTSLP